MTLTNFPIWWRDSTLAEKLMTLREPLTLTSGKRPPLITKISRFGSLPSKSGNTRSKSLVAKTRRDLSRSKVESCKPDWVRRLRTSKEEWRNNFFNLLRPKPKSYKVELMKSKASWTSHQRLSPLMLTMSLRLKNAMVEKKLSRKWKSTNSKIWKQLSQSTSLKRKDTVTSTPLHSNPRLSL